MPVNTTNSSNTNIFRLFEAPPGNFTTISPKAPITFGFSPQPLSANSWSSPLSSPPPRRSSIPRWNAYSSSIASLQYQLSPCRGVDCLDPANSFGSSVAGDRGGSGLLSTSHNGEADDNGFGKLTPRSHTDANSTEKDASEYWKSNNVTLTDLERWTVSIRRWLHGTILRRVVDEIASVNAKISKTSDDAVLIGSTTLSTLEQLAKGKYQHISSLPTLLRFLDCTKAQSYLVFRLQELSRGSCLGEFRWDGGSRSTVSPWKDYLPNDTMILLHMFSAYMDACLPPHPKCLSGRSFGQLHLVRTPDKPDLKSKYTAQLYVAKIQPPLIKVVFDGITYVFPSVCFVFNR
ncbi:unnamed protein product [Mesocestoides corti]|uniref:Transmembrane protein 209 n=1 Tax=Mesocestoides corti TaxID=53468 RepID=A0A0R3U3U9_MESCO|nr:unnamed protein product [Mesocestoides corti]